MGDTIQIPTEPGLWNDFISGSDEAFKIIYEMYIQTLFKYGLHFTKDEDLVFDGIQELFIDLYNNKSKLKSTDNIKFFLFTLLKRKIFRLLKNENRYVSLNSDNLPFTYFLTSTDDIENINNSDQFDLVKKAMNELSDRQREAIYLRFIVGLNYEELAQALQLNYQSARNLIHRSIEKLKMNCNKVHPGFIYFALLKVV